MPPSAIPSPRLVGALERLRSALTSSPSSSTSSPVPAEVRSAFTPSVRVRVEAPDVTPRPALTASTSLSWLDALDLSPTARRLAELLTRLGADVARARGYHVTPSSVVFHAPASLVALSLGVSRRHLYRLLPALVERGLIDQGGHASRVGDRNLYDGCLWAVKFAERVGAPRIRPEDWRHEHRPFADDLKAKRTASALMAQLQTQQASEEETYAALLRWAVAPGSTSDRCSLVVTSAPSEVRELVYSLPGLADVESGKRAAEVGRTASAISKALRDEHSRRYHCALIWSALRSPSPRHSLQALANAVVRLLADLQEGAPWRRPAAVFVARWNAAPTG